MKILIGLFPGDGLIGIRIFGLPIEEFLFYLGTALLGAFSFFYKNVLELRRGVV